MTAKAATVAKKKKAKTLAEHLEASGLTDVQVAYKCGVNWTTVRNWRLGKMPALNSAFALSHLLGKSIEELCCEFDPGLVE